MPTAAVDELRVRARVLDALKEGVAIIGDGAVITYANPALDAMFGYGPGELVGQPFAVLGGPDQARRTREILAVVERDGLWEGELTDRRRDGSILVTQARLVELTIEGTRHLVSIRSDVTERRQAEAKLILSDRLTSVGRLAGGVAHEINNPLSYVSSNLDLIAAELARLQLHELEPLIADARQGTERVRAIVRGLQSFSYTSEDRRAPVDIRRLLVMSINMSLNDIRPRARLITEFGDVPNVDANEARLTQVFMSLLVNAAHAITTGNPTGNTIRVTTTTDDRGRAVISIHDSGAGIAPDLVHRIFDPFFTTKPAGSATGLGLAIAHGIVTGMGGEIDVESKLGTGSTFRVMLPGLAERRRAPSVPGDDPPMPRARVLLIDDDAYVATAVRRVLKGCEVTVCPSGEAGLAWIANGAPIDVILCDVMMANLTGMDVYAEVARSHPSLAPRIVFMTAGAYTSEAQEFLDSIPNPKLDKPFEPRRLRDVVRAMVT